MAASPEAVFALVPAMERNRSPRMIEGSRAAMDKRIAADVESMRASLTGIKAAAER